MLVNWVDISLVSVFVISTLIGLVRGMVNELLTLITWIVAVLIGYFCAPIVGNFLSFIQTELLRNVIGGVLIFFAIILLGSIVSYAINGIIKIGGFMKFIDKFLGISFGVLRGCFIIMFGVLVCSSTLISEYDWWKKSNVINVTCMFNDDLIESMPASWQKKINYFIEEFSF